MDWIYFAVIGLIAGWLAGQIMKGKSFGLIGDLIIGCIGALLGGWLFGVLNIYPGGGLLGALIVATLGAMLLLYLLRLIKK
ncbi:MAG: GlsB/YeaQ/YmgE family stress response membrane protein [Planctomycetota bacterium]